MNTRVKATNSIRKFSFFLRSYWVPISLVTISSVYLTTVTLLHSYAVSPIDEWVYIDYLVKIPEQGIVRKGEIVDPFVLNLLSCHGNSPFGPLGTACGSTPVLADFPNSGISTADPYTPLYFYSAFIIGQVIQLFTALPELVSWRLSGMIWFSGTIILFWLLLRKWNVSNFTIFVWGLLLTSSPFVWWTFTYVSTDATSLFFGSLLLLIATKIVRQELKGYWFILFSAIAVLFKLINLFAVGIAAAFLLIHALWEWRNSRLRIERNSAKKPNYSLIKQALIGISAVFIGALLQWLWLRLNVLMAVSDLTAEQAPSHPFDIKEILIQLTSFLPSSITSGAVDRYIPGFVYAPLSWLTIVSVLAAALITLRQQKEFPMVIAVTLSTFLAAPVLAFALIYLTNSYFQLPARYGAGLIPGMLLIGALVVKAQWPLWIFFTYAIALIGLGVWFSSYLAILAP